MLIFKVDCKCTNTSAIDISFNFQKIQQHLTLRRLRLNISKFKYCKRCSFYSCYASTFFPLLFLTFLHSISLKYYFDRCIPLRSPCIYNTMRPHYTCLQVINSTLSKYPLLYVHCTYYP